MSNLLNGVNLSTVWPSGLTPYLYQIEGAEFILKHKNTYLADEPGLGKTIQAIIAMNTIGTRDLIVIVCPPFLCLNWEKEIETWSTKNLRVQIIRKMTDKIGYTANVVIVPDSILHSPLVHGKFSLKKIGILIVDEAHRFKTHDAKRTKGLQWIAKTAQRIIALSGTPMPNRPMELHTMIHLLDKNIVATKTRHQFGVRYCKGHHNGFGWDYNGASKLEELAEKLKTGFMLRRRKIEVLKDLPEKIVQILELEAGDAAPALEREQREFKKQLDKMKFTVADVVDKGHFETILPAIGQERKAIAFAKVKQVKNLIDDILENPNQKLIVFGYHNEPLKELASLCREYFPLLIQGDTKQKDRQLYVDVFQSPGGSRLLVGN